MKAILNTFDGQNVIVLCDSLQEYTETQDKSDNVVYLIKKK